MIFENNIAYSRLYTEITGFSCWKSFFKEFMNVKIEFIQISVKKRVFSVFNWRHDWNNQYLKSVSKKIFLRHLAELHQPSYIFLKFKNFSYYNLYTETPSESTLGFEKPMKKLGMDLDWPLIPIISIVHQNLPKK